MENKDKRNENIEQTEGEITRTRVERALAVSDVDPKSNSEDYALIGDIIVSIARKEYMSSVRAMDILDDAKKIIPYISEVRLL